MTYCPLHDTHHGLPHGRICPDHSCECTWTVEDGIGIRLASRCPIHRDCTAEPEPRPYEHVLSDDSEPGDLG
jgi:hypothetical protein